MHCHYCGVEVLQENTQHHLGCPLYPTTHIIPTVRADRTAGPCDQCSLHSDNLIFFKCSDLFGEYDPIHLCEGCARIERPAYVQEEQEQQPVTDQNKFENGMESLPNSKSRLLMGSIEELE